MDGDTVEFYNRNARAQCALYDGADMDWLAEVLKDVLKPGISVLDAGCGSGRDARRLATLGCRVTACDASEPMIACAKERSGGEGIEFLVRSFPLSDEDPLLSRTFDLVLSMAMLMHIPRTGIRRVLEQLSALTGEGGVLVLSWCNRESPDERLYERYGREEIGGWLEEMGYRCRFVEPREDALGRPVLWHTVRAARHP